MKEIALIKFPAIENFVPIVRDNTIKKMISLIKENKVSKILEIGTAVGYSGIMMLENSQAHLTTIEKNQDRAMEAKENFEKCNLSQRVNLIIGDALEEIVKLKDNKYDFIFLDGPKGQYIKYYPYLKEMLNGGGILFADNILMGGLLEDQDRVNHKNRTMVKNMQTFLEILKEDEDFETTFYTIDDGFAVCIKNDRNL